MNKLRSIQFQIHYKYNGQAFFLCCLMLCVSMILTSCSRDSQSDNNNIPNEIHNDSQQSLAHCRLSPPYSLQVPSPEHI